MTTTRLLPALLLLAACSSPPPEPPPLPTADQRYDLVCATLTEADPARAMLLRALVQQNIRADHADPTPQLLAALEAFTMALEAPDRVRGCAPESAPTDWVAIAACLEG
jgi:hypothetical protein